MKTTTKVSLFVMVSLVVAGFATRYHYRSISTSEVAPLSLCATIAQEHKVSQCSKKAKHPPHGTWEISLKAQPQHAGLWLTVLQKFHTDIFNLPGSDGRHLYADSVKVGLGKCFKIQRCESELLEYFGQSRNSSLGSEESVNRYLKSNAYIDAQRYMAIDHCVRLDQQNSIENCQLKLGN